MSFPDAYTGKRIVVVNARNSALGAHLAVRLVQRGAKVFTIDSQPLDPLGSLELFPERDGIRSLEVGLTDVQRLADTLRENQIEMAAVYLGAAEVAAPRGRLSRNILESIAFLEAASRSNTVRALLLESSAKVYGAVDGRAAEATPFPAQLDRFSGSVAGLDLIATSMYTGRMQVRVCRLANVVAPLDLCLSRIVPNLTLRLLMNDTPRIVTTQTEARRAYLAVHDLVEALLLLLGDCMQNERRGKDCAFNIGGDTLLTPTEILSLIRRRLGRDGAEPWSPRPPRTRAPEAQVVWLDTTKIRGELGWRPTIPIEEAIAEAVDAFRERLPHIYGYIPQFRHHEPDRA